MSVAPVLSYVALQVALSGRPAWFGDPIVEAVIVLATAAYVVGLVQLRRAPSRGGNVADRRHLLAFFAGMAVAAAALLSPMDALGDRLFSIHMAQHLLLIVGAAPLLAVSNAHLVLAAALPERVSARRSALLTTVARQCDRAGAAWLAAAAFVATVWIWHIPAAHDFATDNRVAHSVEHLTILATATAFWRVVITSGKRRIGPGMAALMVSLVGLSGALLSALIMFAPAPLCRAYIQNPMADQVLAGLLMCIPASLVYAASTIWALWRLIGNEPRHAR